MELIRLENLCKNYRRGDMEIPVLRGVSLTIKRGELVALVGSSGSGKSTLMNILGCLDRPTSGSYKLEGQEISTLGNDERANLRNAKIGFVFQNFNLLARTSALNNVRMPLDYSPAHPTDTDSRNRATRMLEIVGLSERMDHEPSALSGGQQQRVAIARSLINRPELLLADEPTGNLDSNTAEEVLRMLQRLNEEEGLTVIIVTHDEAVARHVKRIIRMKDGVIVEEAGAGLSETGRHRQQQHPESDLHSATKSAQSRTPAKPFLEFPRLKHAARTTRMAFGALRRNIMRSALTCLGIIIGVAAVIAMMEIGGGSSHAIQQAIASLGASVIQIDSVDVSIGGVSTGHGGSMDMTIEDANALRRECSALQNVAPSVDSWGQVIAGNKNWKPGRILGSTPDYLAVRNWPVVEGEPFTMDDVRSSSAVCLIGQTVAEKLFGTDSPIGKEVRLRGVALKVVGLLAHKGASVMGSDQDDFLLAPLTTVKYRIMGVRQATQSTASTSSTTFSPSQVYVGQQPPLYPPASPNQATDNPQTTRFADLDDVWVAAGTPDNIPLAIKQITDVLRDRHHIQPGHLDDFRIRDWTEMSQTFASTSRVMTNLLLVVALISLIVGGVGIMNIMLVSVTERTREIGIRMAVGARARDILRQFLVEALVLCLAGGLAGILLGRTISIVVTKILHWATMTSLPAIIAAVAVSATVGIIFGYYPAWKASRLDPIQALRYE